VNGDTSLSLAVHPAAWEDKLPELIPTHEVEKLDRYHYLCCQVPFDWRQHVSEGYTVRRLDRALLEEVSPDFAARLHEWIDFEEMWGTVDRFLDKGVGFCVLHGDEPIAWCVSDCVAGPHGKRQVDVGIYTHPDHRRRGLATAAVVATIEHCLGHGFSAVGWHCNADNVGSWRTAEKAGFTRNREYAYYYYMCDEIDHLAELGWYWFKKGEYQKTAQYYERVFTQRDENPDYYYHLAAVAWATLGDTDKALKYLNAAVDHGWSHVEYSRELEAFSILHSLPEWEAVLARMEEAG
jgi:RimJ/RimL family protein N-acetyltransferase